MGMKAALKALLWSFAIVGFATCMLLGIRISGILASKRTVSESGLSPDRSYKVVKSHLAGGGGFAP
jgi:hypothetical protein